MANALSLSGPMSNSLTTVARTVSDIFSPAVLSIPCMMLGVLASEEAGTYRFALLYFLVAVPLPILYVTWLMKTGRVTDFHLPVRRDRIVPFALSILSGLGAIGLLYYYRAPLDFLAPVSTALVQTMALFVITLVWQISIHTATTAGLITFAILALGNGAWVLAPLVPTVMWARVYLGRHTLSQTVAGAILGCLTFTTLFALRGMIW